MVQEVHVRTGIALPGADAVQRAIALGCAGPGAGQEVGLLALRGSALTQVSWASVHCDLLRLFPPVKCRSGRGSRPKDSCAQG